jgi:hypothetical protein
MQEPKSKQSQDLASPKRAISVAPPEQGWSQATGPLLTFGRMVTSSNSRRRRGWKDASFFIPVYNKGRDCPAVTRHGRPLRHVPVCYTAPCNAAPSACHDFSLSRTTQTSPRHSRPELHRSNFTMIWSRACISSPKPGGFCILSENAGRVRNFQHHTGNSCLALPHRILSENFFPLPAPAFTLREAP